MSSHYNENTLELTLIEWLNHIGYTYYFGPDIAYDGNMPLRDDYSQVVLTSRLEQALIRINAGITTPVMQEVVKKLIALPSQDTMLANRIFHSYLTDGVDIETVDEEGRPMTMKIAILDKLQPTNNDFVVVNQFTIQERQTRRPDILLFVNGLPLVVIELKDPTNEKVDTDDAYHQIQTYKKDLPTLFAYNACIVISDGIGAQIGTISADRDRFMSWKSVDGEQVAKSTRLIESLVYGALHPHHLIDLICNYIVFEIGNKKQGYIKKIAAYHQYFAVQKALDKTKQALVTDQKCGIVWHTQGSGKSLTMVFYAGKIIQQLDNPTLVIITDRNDLDDQLFGTFVNCEHLLRQTPKQAENRDHLRQLLQVNAGGVVFTTIQKFQPDEGKTVHSVLSDRKNIIIIADEAHRTQYGLKAKIDTTSGELTYGYAKYLRDALPNASFIGFTGTPIDHTDKSTPAVFGEYIDVYDIQRAVEDHATVPIYYETRLAKIVLEASEKPTIDSDFELLTEHEEVTTKEKLKSKRAQLEAMVGTEKRLRLVAQDIVNHFEQRQDAMDGKGMIVSMSRRIAVELYEQIIKLRPHWHSDDDNAGVIKVVMTGSASDPLSYQQHIRSKEGRRELEARMKDPNDSLKLVIVRDMWLTGFDVPCLHTMYIDKPMQGHGLMQAIARVNRVWKDKQGGLIVDYLGIANDLKEALSQYTQDPEEMMKNMPSIEQAIQVFLTKYEIIKEMYHGYQYLDYFTATPAKKTDMLASATEHILSLDDGKNRYLTQVTELTHAMSLIIATDTGILYRDEVAFFQAIKVMIMKCDETEDEGGKKSTNEYDHVLKQIIADAVTSNEVIDVFKVAGIDKPEIGILSEEFLEEVMHMKHKNLAFELLKKLLNDNIRAIGKRNIVTGRSFSDMLEQTIARYQNRTVESAQVIAELIELAKKLSEEHKKGEKLGLKDDEVAFYDALSVNESAIKELGDETLKQIARELVVLVRKNATIDWEKKESVQATLRFYIKKLLRIYKYPPDLEQQAIDTVMKQALLNAELLVG